MRFIPTKANYPVENPLSQLTGNAWQKLKSLSIEPFHELFPETDEDGHPRLTFRPIPWVLNPFNTSIGQLLSKDILFGNLPRVEIPAIDIIDFDLGEDNHNRYNLFLTVVASSKWTVQDSIGTLTNTDPRTGFPRIQQNSIRRHGLRMMYNEINSLIQFGQEKVDEALLQSYNNLILEYWNEAVFLESGTLQLLGNNGVKLGKVLKLEKGAPYNSNKLFYIEGYEDHFSIDSEGVGMWTQSVMVTRGIEEQDLLPTGSVTRRDESYENSGDFTEDN